jgi:hypothetical protein
MSAGNTRREEEQGPRRSLWARCGLGQQSVKGIALLLAIGGTLLLCASSFATSRPEAMEVMDAEGLRRAASSQAKRARMRSKSRAASTSAAGTLKHKASAGGPADSPEAVIVADSPRAVAAITTDEYSEDFGKHQRPLLNVSTSPRGPDASPAAPEATRASPAPAAPPERHFWRDEEGGHFNGLALYRTVCVAGVDRVAPLLVGSGGRKGKWEQRPPKPTDGTQLLVNEGDALRVDDGDPMPPIQRGLTILTRRPHGSNIAHAYVEAIWLTLHVLRHLAEGSIGQRLPALAKTAWPGTLDPAAVRVLHTPYERAYAEGYPFAVNKSSWQQGITAAAALTAGIPHTNFAPNPTAEGPQGSPPPTAKTACFEWLLAVGTSREMCVDASCRRDGFDARDRTKEWVRDLAYSAAGAPHPRPVVASAGHDEDAKPSRPLRLGLYLREDQNKTKYHRRFRDGPGFARCLVDAVRNKSTAAATADTDSSVVPTPLPTPLPMALPGDDGVRGELIHVQEVPQHWGPQARLWASFDVLIGANGAGNTNAAFMPRRSGVVVLAGCSQGYLSWMGTTRLPDQDVVTYKLCTKRSSGVIFERPPDGGIRIPCTTLVKLRGGRLKMPLAAVVPMLLRRRVDGQVGDDTAASEADSKAPAVAAEHE